MTKKEIMTKFEEATKDEAYMDSLAEAASAEEVRELLAEKDITVTEAEAVECFKAIKIAETDGELSEDELDSVNGGSFIVGATIIGGGVAFAIGVYRSMRCRR